MGDLLKMDALEPSDCDDKAIGDFMALVLAGGEVAQEGLERRIRCAVRLVFLSVGGCLSGIAALKRPEQGYRKHVSSRAGFPLPEAGFPFELGWVFVMPRARGRRFSLDLTRAAMSAADTSGVFATSRTDNDRMHASLAKLAFVLAGHPYTSSRGNYKLQLFVRHTAQDATQARRVT